MAVMVGCVVALYRLSSKHSPASQAANDEGRAVAHRIAQSTYFLKGKKHGHLRTITLVLETADLERIRKEVTFSFRHPDRKHITQMSRLEIVRFEHTATPLRRVNPADECAYLTLKRM